MRDISQSRSTLIFPFGKPRRSRRKIGRARSVEIRVYIRGYNFTPRWAPHPPWVRGFQPDKNRKASFCSFSSCRRAHCPLRCIKPWGSVSARLGFHPIDSGSPAATLVSGKQGEKLAKYPPRVPKSASRKAFRYSFVKSSSKLTYTGRISHPKNFSSGTEKDGSWWSLGSVTPQRGIIPFPGWASRSELYGIHIRARVWAY